jgi:glycosyltransferase involved in cell wall biosynthesis
MGHHLAVVTCHQWIELAPAALQSVADQTRAFDGVLMVVDPGEHDQEYANLLQTHPVQFYKLPEHQGVAAARNAGFAWAVERGFEWVSFLDEDDLYWPTYLEEMHKAVSLCPRVKLFYPDWAEFADPGYLRRFHVTPEHNRDLLLKTPYIVSASTIHTDVWLKVKEINGTGYDPGLEAQGLRWEDYLFYIEAALCGFQFSRVGLGLLRVRTHPGQGGEIANRTIPQWTEYVQQKVKSLYGKTARS